MLLNAPCRSDIKGLKPWRTFGRAGLMLFNALVGKPEFRKHAPLLVRQLYNVGVLSMLIIGGFWRVHRNGVRAARLSGSDHL